MFMIRQSKPEDVPTLHKLAKTVYFINLPPDDRIIAGKIEHSQRCFRAASDADQAPKDPKRAARAPGGAAGVGAGGVVSAKKGSGPAKDVVGVSGPGSQKRSHAGKGLAQRETESDMFMFSVVEAQSGVVVGTSQVRAQMGGKGDPNWRMIVREKKFHAPSIGFGTTHTVMQLDGDQTGPTEVGGLILDPGFRGHPMRPGRFISFVRFHFMGLHRERFRTTTLAEMMGSVNERGDSVFWDAFGRKFFPVSYPEADRFCQHNRAFISELFPKEEVYITLLPLEVQNLVGVVAKDTVPARRLLESLGFTYRGYIDPFDGGPHLDTPTDAIPLVRDTRRSEGQPSSNPDRCTHGAIVSHTTREGEFRAVETWIEPVREASKGGPVRLLPRAMEVLGIDAGAEVGVTPLGTFSIPREMSLEGVEPAPTSGSSKGRGRRVKA